MIEEHSHFPTPVIGYRAWILDGPWLESHFAVSNPDDYRPGEFPLHNDRGGHRWTPGVNEAGCYLETTKAVRKLPKSMMNLLGRPPHECPDRDCACGLYAMHETSGARGYAHITCIVPDRPRVMGAIVGWGKIAVHSDGFRAQYARIVALKATAGLPARPAAVHYGVPLVGYEEELQTIALEHGAPLPKDAIPEKPKAEEDPILGHLQRLMTQTTTTTTTTPHVGCSCRSCAGKFYNYHDPPTIAEREKKLREARERLAEVTKRFNKAEAKYRRSDPYYEALREYREKEGARKKNKKWWQL